MRIERFSPATDRGAVNGCYDLYTAARRTDDPHGPLMSARTFREWIPQGWTCWPREAALAMSGAPLGWYLLDLPQDSPRCLAMIAVDPSRRRQGAGTALLRHLTLSARRHGRVQLSAQARIGSAGEAFTIAAGGRPGTTRLRQSLDMTTLPRLPQNQAPDGYSLLHWTGPTPEEYLGQVAAVSSALSDAPHDDADGELRWDVQQVRNANRRILARRLRYYTVAAQHLASGELAGLTQAYVAPDDPAWGSQDMTAVAPAHRGHGLGMRLKTELLRLLAEHEPALKHLVTGTADTNEPMNAINQALGFTVIAHWADFTLDLTRTPATRGERG
jgi:GNAT superfamily N-acetyltransferase